MARIPEAELERLKTEIAVERLVTARGVALERRGADLVGLCPFHENHEPSLVVSPAKNLWHCLGACRTGGSVVDWVMKAEGVSFRHAVELLRADFSPLAASSSSRIAKHSTVRKLAPPIEFDADDQAVLRQVIDYYHEALKQSPEALLYLESRGLHSSEAIDRFKLGFANRTLGYRLPANTRVAGAEIRSRLQKLGILRESGHEHFTGSVVVPIFDETGNVTELYGRKITAGLRPGTPLHLYLPGPHKGVWNIEAVHTSKEIILCEALLDALTFWCAGYRNVTASYGVEGFTADHLAAFKRFGVERVLIAYDRDDAGERAAEALAAKLMAEGIGCYRIHFPKGMDANEYAEKVKPAEKSLGVVIRNALWLGKGKAPAAPAMEREEAVVVEVETVAQSEAAWAAKEETTPAPSVRLLTQAELEQPANDASPLAAAVELEPEASPEPPAPKAAEIPAEVKPEEVVIRLGDRRYRVRGLTKNLSFDCLKVNLLAALGEALHVDTLDLYSARQRAAYVKQAAVELGIKEDVVKKDLGKVLAKLEELQEAAIRKTLEPKSSAAEIDDSERAAALELLRDPDLLSRILADFERCGVVGEETNKLTGYLAAVSRKLEEPLAVIIQSSSAAGKSSLMDAILALVPEEERVKYSAMTGQSLFYMGETDLKGKVLAIVEEAGAERATYALKLLQSEGELTIASTGKDPETGKLVTHEYRVEGPVAIFLTTTAVEIDEELLNRAIVLTVDENREQTRAIHKLQRERQTLEGLLARRGRDEVLHVHQNAQRLLRPLLVANPYARSLTFFDSRTRTRRDHMKYLTLIRTIALLHQHQRPVRTVEHRGKMVEYVEVILEDIATANRLSAEVLGRSLDELAPQTRRLLLELDEMAAAECQKRELERADYRFSRRDVVERTGLGYTQVRLHLDRLVELEHVLVHHGGRGQGFVYELLYDGKGKDGEPFLSGLIEVSPPAAEPTEATATTSTSRGAEGGFSLPGRGPGVSPGWVKVKVRACSLNYLDIFSRRGLPGIRIELPGITGGDCAGEIAELGDGVTGWRIGQRVLVDPVYFDPETMKIALLGENRRGALAEFCSVHESQLIALSDGVSDEHAACLPVAYGTSHRMIVTRGDVQPGEKVLILGASGGVGTSSLLLAKMRGAHVIAAAGDDEKCARLRALGADETINYTTTDFHDYCKRTTGSFLRGGGYEVVVNFTGGDTWARSLRCAKRGGRILTCGATAGFDPKTDLRYLWTGELNVLGSNGWRREDLTTLLDLVATGRLKPVIDRVMPLSQGIEACGLLKARRFLGKIVVRPDA